MLVLSRKTGESIVIGDGIVIRVLGMNGRAIRLGIEAPPEVSIRREELALSAATHGPASGEPDAAVFSNPIRLKSR